jgi:hypothetical protein
MNGLAEGPPNGRNPGPLLLIGVATVLVVVCGAVGYLLGTTSAPSQADADIERRAGTKEALKHASRQAFRRAEDEGQAAGERSGRREAKRSGRRRGGADGEEGAEAQLAAIAQEEEEAAARAEAEERAENCGAPLFVPGYCPTDEEIERESLAESLCGPGDPALVQEAAEQGIQCGRPR